MITSKIKDQRCEFFTLHMQSRSIFLSNEKVYVTYSKEIEVA